MASDKNSAQEAVRKSFVAKQRLIETARIFFQNMAAVLKNMFLYPEDHPRLHSSVEKLLDRTEDLLTKKMDAAFYLIDGELFFETLSIPLDQNLSLVVEQLSAKSIGGIIFSQGVTKSELIRFAALLNKTGEIFSEEESIDEVMAKEGIRHITIHHAMLVDRQTGSEIKAQQKKAADIFKETIEALKEVVQAVHSDKASGMRKVNSVIKTMVDYVLDNKDALIGLTNIKMYDEYTFAHCVNTAILAVSTGTYLSLSKPQLSALGVGALMHDIGKVNIPPEIINKPGMLTEKEWEIIQRHPVDGALFLSSVQNISKLATVIAFEHHHHGPKAYPPLKSYHKRHPFSQIVSLADSYEAITASRVYYASKIPPDEAIRILLKNQGITSSVALLKAFINTIGIFPAGTLLQLDSGEIGLVINQTQDLMRPRVLLLNKFDGSEKESGQVVSLVETAGGKYKRSIAGTIDPNMAKINVQMYFD
ncbi:MAG TPA: HD domain-containing protein [Deltaproteobacteria bacterium]|nr:HD domain-containing protein [Deltaproteobacteria bacterium]